MSKIKARLFIKESISKGKQIVLKDKDYNYLINVMRSKIGDSISLINGKDGEFLGKIVAIEKRACIVHADEQIKKFTKLPDLYLAFAPIKRIEMIAEKGTELGVTEFLPIITQRTIVKKVNTNKFQARIKEAVEQCERLDMPAIREITKLPKFINTLQKDDILILCEERSDSNKSKASEILEKLKQKGIKGKVYALIGPEGGFNPAELDIIKKFSGTHSISLGNRILRTETAVIAILTLIQEHLL